MSEQPVRRQPVLVTGTHRSGTTWLGRMLSLSHELAVVHEPFNPANSWSWLEHRPEHWYEYVTDESSTLYDRDIERLKALRFPTARLLGRVRSPRDLGAVGRDAAQVLTWRREQRSLLMKDPIAFFNAPWLADEHQLCPVVCVRHPAAFVSSLKRLDWQFSFANWTSQPALLDGPLHKHADEIRRAAGQNLDVVEQGILVWRVMNDVVRDDYANRSGWQVIRYEDYAADPQGQFPELYSSLGLQWNERAAQAMRTFTTPSQQGEVAEGEHMSVRRNSQSAMWTWLDRLSADEIQKVRHDTEDVASHFYTDADWTND